MLRITPPRPTTAHSSANDMIVAVTARPERQEVQFRITYDGPEVQAGRMEIKDLAPAMLSMAQLLEHTAQVLNGTASGLRVEISADFKSGSFGYEVVALADIGKQIADSIDIRTVLEVLGIGSAGGLLGLVKWLRGRKVAAAVPANIDSTEVRTTDGDSIVVQKGTYIAFNNSTIRVDLSGVIEPLRNEGITEFRVGRGDVAEAVVYQEEVEFFEPLPPSGKVLQDKTTTEIVQVVGLFFYGRKKWRLRMPDGSPFAAELDRDFMKRVESHDVTFGAGDALEVEMHSVVRIDGQKLSAERDIIRVIRHIPAAKQLDLLDPPPS